jgi:DNA-binding response OmpR family regulator
MNLRERVLVIDDNPQIQKLVTVNLQARGFIVQTAGSGEEVIDLFKLGQFDLILLDLILPGISGIDVCIWVRQQSEIPIIVLSAREDEEIKVRALDAGADDYVTNYWQGYAPFCAAPIPALLIKKAKSASKI